MLFRSGTDRVAPSYYFRGGPTTGGDLVSTQENDLLRSLLAPTLGTTAGGVPDLGVLLVAPMTRGAKVSLR